MENVHLDENLISLLKWKLVLMPGFQTDSKSHILILPDLQAVNIILTDIKQILNYFSSIARNIDKKATFTMIIDRRSSDWNHTKSLLTFLKLNFKYTKIYLLKPTGIIKSLFGLFSYTQDAKEEFFSDTVNLDKGIKITNSQASWLLNAAKTHSVEEWIKERRMIESLEVCIHKFEHQVSTSEDKEGVGDGNDNYATTETVTTPPPSSTTPNFTTNISASPSPQLSKPSSHNQVLSTSLTQPIPSQSSLIQTSSLQSSQLHSTSSSPSIPQPNNTPPFTTIHTTSFKQLQALVAKRTQHYAELSRDMQECKTQAQDKLASLSQQDSKHMHVSVLERLAIRMKRCLCHHHHDVHIFHSFMQLALRLKKPLEIVHEIQEETEGDWKSLQVIRESQIAVNRKLSSTSSNTEHFANNVTDKETDTQVEANGRAERTTDRQADIGLTLRNCTEAQLRLEWVCRVRNNLQERSMKLASLQQETEELEGLVVVEKVCYGYQGCLDDHCILMNGSSGDVAGGEGEDERKRKSSERVEVCRRLLEMLQNAVKVLEERCGGVGEVVEVVVKQINRSLQLFSELDKVVKWNEDSQRLAEKGAMVLVSSNSNEDILLVVDELSIQKSGRPLDGCVVVDVQLVHACVNDQIDKQLQLTKKHMVDMDVLIGRLVGKGAELVRKNKQKRGLFKGSGQNDSMTQSLFSQSACKKSGEATIILDSKVIPSMLANQQSSIKQHVLFGQSHSMPHHNGTSGWSRKHKSDWGSFDSSNQDRVDCTVDVASFEKSDDVEKYIHSRDGMVVIQHVKDTGDVRRRRGHVIQELIETERVYIKALKDILEGYSARVEEDGLREMVPAEVRDDRSLLFGNLPQIYDFHSKEFLKCVEESKDQPAMVAECFIQHKQSFQLYSFYCQNKVSRADLLMQRIGDNDPFFQECRRALQHQLPLSSYLLKPVQRITKYHLLLREMASMVINEEEAKVLRKCMNCVKEVVSQVNNSMHQMCITNYSEDFSNLGRLLVQGMLEVCVDRRTNPSTLKSNYQKRHVFLYDRKILFCKRKDASNPMSPYIYKHSLNTDEVGPLREGCERRFELVCKSEMWCFQATSNDNRLTWVEGIKKVLFEQMQNIKARAKRLQLENSSSGMMAAPVTRPTSHASDSTLSSDLENSMETSTSSK